MTDKRFVGADAQISINNTLYQVSNVTLDREVNETDVQQTQGTGGNNPLEAARIPTGIRYSGSFEIEGKNEGLRDVFWDSQGNPVRFTMTLVQDPGGGSGTQRTITLSECFVTSESIDNPSDDIASSSWDFVAESYNVTS